VAADLATGRYAGGDLWRWFQLPPKRILIVGAAVTALAIAVPDRPSWAFLAGVLGLGWLTAGAAAKPASGSTRPGATPSKLCRCCSAACSSQDSCSDGRATRD